MPIVTRLRNYRYHMDASGDSRFYAAGTELWMPKGTLFEDADLQYEVYPSDTDHADIHQLTAQPIPLRQSAELTLPVRLDKAFDGKKLYVARVDGDRRIYCGGTYRYGRITARIKELGTYTVCADTIAPRIAPIGERTWKTRGIVTLRITDAETGIRSYEGKIDGRWVLFKYSSKNARLTCDLRAEGIGPGHHTIEVEVTDMRGNKRVVSYNGTF